MTSLPERIGLFRAIERGLAVALLAGGLSAAGDDITAYKHSKQIKAAERHRDQLVRVQLDADVYEVCDEQYNDVRIVRKDGTEIPRLIRRSVKLATASREQRHEAVIENLSKTGDNAIRVTIRVPETVGEIVGLELETPLRNYERSLTVHGQRAARGPRVVLARDSLLYDYSRFADVSKKTVHFPPGTYRRLDVTIHAVTDVQAARLTKLKETFTSAESKTRTEIRTVTRRPFRIDAVYVLTRQQSNKIESFVKTEYPVGNPEFTTDEDGTTVVSLGTRRLPLTQLRLETQTGNFSRPAVVTVDQDGKKRILGKSTLYELSYRGIQEENLSVTFPETRSRRLRLLVRNANAPPLRIDNVAAIGNVYEAVFIARPNERYRLVYGSGAATKPAHDLTAVKRLLDEGYGLVQGKLLAQSANPEHAPPSFDVLNSKIFFVAVLVLMAAVLAFALYSASKRV